MKNNQIELKMNKSMLFTISVTPMTMVAMTHVWIPVDFAIETQSPNCEQTKPSVGQSTVEEQRLNAWPNRFTKTEIQ